MSIPPPNDPSGGCSSNSHRPLRMVDFVEALELLNNINRVNVVEGNLTGIEYGTSDQELDIRRPVYRWDEGPTRRSLKMASKHGLKDKLPTPLIMICITSLNMQEPS
ncbi:hypothetical protein ACSQ67_015944 [Phaseolus vulgaris]